MNPPVSTPAASIAKKPRRPRSVLRALFLSLVTVALTALLVVYAFWDVDLVLLRELLAGGNYLVVAPFQVLLAVYFAFTAWRWGQILRPLGSFRTAQLLPAMMIGFGGNNLLPAHMGELVRVFVFCMRQNCSRSAVLATLVVERILDVLGVLVLYAAAAMSMRELPENLRTGLWGSALFIATAAVCIVTFLAVPHRFVGLWEKVGRILPARLSQFGTRALLGVESGLGALRSPGAVALMTLYSVIKWACSAGMVWLSMWAFGVTLTPAHAVIVVSVSVVAVSLPSVPGFFGVLQAAFVFALVPFGFSREAAIAGSVLFLLAQWVPVTCIGVAFFLTTGLGFRRVQEAVGQEL